MVSVGRAGPPGRRRAQEVISHDVCGCGFWRSDLGSRLLALGSRLSALGSWLQPNPRGPKTNNRYNDICPPLCLFILLLASRSRLCAPPDSIVSVPFTCRPADVEQTQLWAPINQRRAREKGCSKRRNQLAGANQPTGQAGQRLKQIN